MNPQNNTPIPEFAQLYEPSLMDKIMVQRLQAKGAPKDVMYLEEQNGTFPGTTKVYRFTGKSGKWEDVSPGLFLRPFPFDEEMIQVTINQMNSLGMIDSGQGAVIPSPPPPAPKPDGRIDDVVGRPEPNREGVFKPIDGQPEPSVGAEHTGPNGEKYYVKNLLPGSMAPVIRWILKGSPADV